MKKLSVPFLRIFIKLECFIRDDLIIFRNIGDRGIMFEPFLWLIPNYMPSFVRNKLKVRNCRERSRIIDRSNVHPKRWNTNTAPTVCHARFLRGPIDNSLLDATYEFPSKFDDIRKRSIYSKRERYFWDRRSDRKTDNPVVF